MFFFGKCGGLCNRQKFMLKWVVRVQRINRSKIKPKKNLIIENEKKKMFFLLRCAVWLELVSGHGVYAWTHFWFRNEKFSVWNRITKKNANISRVCVFYLADWTSRLTTITILFYLFVANSGERLNIWVREREKKPSKWRERKKWQIYVYCYGTVIKRKPIHSNIFTI